MAVWRGLFPSPPLLPLSLSNNLKVGLIKAALDDAVMGSSHCVLFFPSPRIDRAEQKVSLVKGILLIVMDRSVRIFFASIGISSFPLPFFPLSPVKLGEKRVMERNRYGFEESSYGIW